MASTDGRAKTIAASQARLARIVGRDSDDAGPTAWFALAQYFAEAQIRAITDGGMLVLSRGELPVSAPIVVAGIGATFLREVARRLSRECIDFEALIDVSPEAGPTVSSVAPAASVAILNSRPRIFLVPAWRNPHGLAVPSRVVRHEVRLSPHRSIAIIGDN